jgi:hypothetical protein
MTKKDRKKNKPRGVHAVTQQCALQRRLITSVAPMQAARQSNVLIAYHQAMTALTSGFADGYHLDTIIYALGVAVVLADQRDIGDACIGQLRVAMAGIGRTKTRFLETGRMGVDGPALVAVRAAYHIHERQMQLHTMGELQEAIGEMYRRVEAGKVLARELVSLG